MDITADHNQAFDDAYVVAGKLISIDGGAADVQAIDPLNETRQVEADENANLDDVREKQITIKTADLPATIDADTAVTVDGVDYRITSTEDAGKIGVTLTLETP